jgi:transposase InsO family protein
MHNADGALCRRDRGSPQGGVILPLLANLFLHYAFDRWMAANLPKVPFCRYADDGLIHCRSLTGDHDSQPRLGQWEPDELRGSRPVLREPGAVRFPRATHPYVPMSRGSMYLVAVMDWHSRKILSWRISNTLDSDFCIQALQEALQRYGIPEIFNTDQGAQFTSIAFTQVLKDHGIAISMDGRGRCQDNIFVVRLWWTIKHHYLYLHAFDTGT